MKTKINITEIRQQLKKCFDLENSTMRYYLRPEFDTKTKSLILNKEHLIEEGELEELSLNSFILEASEKTLIDVINEIEGDNANNTFLELIYDDIFDELLDKLRNYLSKDTTTYSDDFNSNIYLKWQKIKFLDYIEFEFAELIETIIRKCINNKIQYEFTF